MFGRSKFMHIPDASDQVMAAFEAHEINELIAFCGTRIARGWLFNSGGAREDAPICDTCAHVDGWGWDSDTEQWVSPYNDYEKANQ